MTALTSVLKRETAVTRRGRPLVIALHPAFVELRLKGKRTRVQVGYDAILDLGYKLVDRARREERRKARMGR